ncbi:HlyD family efflux transporter periplasmic adaptor subunit [Paludibacterium purpuratum]|uniref:Membrane fusion protein (Multidrug efflux system) n=1 Tax=Paludibacterium purpuratum TaxID=1144873 RepID=A0A4V3DV88_9NEIS|nr:HlyD family efflux transporter periplasmic adaptor subunit [Paludibacterium purpuratum]TDR80039.1 membrane fusion protein (multidrug efflux system) [Paludibacterium purpuratum]
MPQEHPTTAPQDGTAMKALRKKLFLALAATVALGAAAGYGYWRLVGSRYVGTDDAYVAADIAQVTAQTAGVVKTVPVEDTQVVKASDVLALLDDSDARIAVEAAAAELEQAKRRVRGYQATDSSLAAQTLARQSEVRRAVAQLAAAQSDAQRATAEWQRRQALAATGAVSVEELAKSQSAMVTAQTNLTAARAVAKQADATYSAAVGTRQANATLIDHASADDNPEVLLARAHWQKAQLDLARTVIRAPVDGVVARRQVQPGQYVQAGNLLLNVVPSRQVHVDANFMEGQLARVHVGQSVLLTSDRYGSAVRYHGYVEGFSGGTGAVFAVIPAQNATGNWIKVVQRLPVRIRLEVGELAAHPLQVGLSMTAAIDSRS